MWVLSTHSLMSLHPVVPEFVQPAGQSVHVKDPAGMFWQSLRACTQETPHEPPVVSATMSAVKDSHRGGVQGQEGKAVPAKTGLFRLKVCTFAQFWWVNLIRARKRMRELWSGFGLRHLCLFSIVDPLKHRALGGDVHHSRHR